MAALHRVCLDNALFLSSFPISDMSDSELEKSAMAPSRWIELGGAFKQPGHLNQRGEILPGGRYLLLLISYVYDIISVLDLGYSSSADCKLVASVRPEGGCDIQDCRAQATPDGMGLTIFSSTSNT